MDPGNNWTQIIVEILRGLFKLVLNRKQKGHRDSDGGPGSKST
jgi:hypothetical protein